MKELLKKLLKYNEENQHRCVGLCNYTSFMYSSRLITFEESNILLNYIKIYRPTLGSKFYDESHEDSPFYWSCYDQKIRIAWLKERIKRTPK